jgi:hypothetical protein
MTLLVSEAWRVPPRVAATTGADRKPDPQNAGTIAALPIGFRERLP